MVAILKMRAILKNGRHFQRLTGKSSDRACTPSRKLIVIMVHDLSLTLNVEKRNNNETPGSDSHILSFIISVFINCSYVLVDNIHHFLYLSSISLLSVFTARP